KYYYEGWPKNKNNVSPLLKPYWNIQAEIHRNPKSHWEHATVKERCPDNRSYIVEDINKVRYRRNRVHLRHKYCNGSDNPTPMRSNSSQGRDEGDRQEPENPKFPQLYKTKSGRVSSHIKSFNLINTTIIHCVHTLIDCINNANLRYASIGPHRTHRTQRILVFSWIETRTNASTDPHRTDRIISNAYMRCVLMTSYRMRMIRARRTMRACSRLPLDTTADYVVEKFGTISTYLIFLKTKTDFFTRRLFSEALNQRLSHKRSITHL
ncbi:hypothetical protein SFRURICE_010496, partial [Spodoptera frugiperda]